MINGMIGSLRRYRAHVAFSPLPARRIDQRHDAAEHVQQASGRTVSSRRRPDLDRLEDQIGWYDRKGGDNRRRYKWLKLLELVVAAALPVVAGSAVPCKWPAAWPR